MHKEKGIRIRCFTKAQNVDYYFFFIRWKIQRNFTLKFMRKLGMSKFKQTENSKMEQKISICLNLLLEGTF